MRVHARIRRDRERAPWANDSRTIGENLAGDDRGSFYRDRERTVKEKMIEMVEKADG